MKKRTKKTVLKIVLIFSIGAFIGYIIAMNTRPPPPTSPLEITIQDQDREKLHLAPQPVKHVRVATQKAPLPRHTFFDYDTSQY